MKKIIANFKMNKTNSEIKKYLINFIPKVDGRTNEIILALPFTALSLAKFMLEGSDISLASQNICDEDEGKNTGEIDGKMLADCGVDYVIIGHSERRSKFKENGKLINKKIKMALKNRLKVILCIGESLTEKNSLKTSEVITSQLEEALKGLYENELENITVAYEPVWAIGSGKIPLIKEIDNVIKTIRKTVARVFSDRAGEKIEIVYGGSVDNKNCTNILRINSLNGLLVGGACLNEGEFAQMLKDIK